MKYILIAVSVLSAQFAFAQTAPNLQIGASFSDVETAMKNTGQDYGATKVEGVNQFTFFITENRDGKSVKASYVVQDSELTMMMKSYPKDGEGVDKGDVKALTKSYVEELDKKYGSAQKMELRNISVWRWDSDGVGLTLVVDHKNESLMLTESDHAFSDDVLLMMDNYENKKSNTPIEYSEFKASKIELGMAYCEIVAHYGEPDDSYVIGSGAVLVYGDYTITLEDGIVAGLTKTQKEK